MSRGGWNFRKEVILVGETALVLTPRWLIYQALVTSLNIEGSGDALMAELICLAS